uniref:Integrase catalytic domain-containing protein n=1 Tax=Tanacetum cinerariifolium TaxID=118510 RepID=A0A6L2P160_TANCI|nr:hypothetical protein [Tanacetum cinerariifolium]
MHNNIMAAGSRDRPPMLETGRYPQWQSRFLRYIDTRPNGDDLRKCILRGPYKPTTVLVQAVAATDDSLAILEHTTVETPMNMSPENNAYFESEKEAILLILTGIGDEIYLTVDACQIAQEMWEAIKRLARNANPLALVATGQANQDLYYQTSKSYKSYAPSSKPSIPTRSHTTTRYKGKEIAKPIMPPSEIASEEDSDPEQAQRDKDMQKNLALIAKYFKKIYKPTNNNLRTSSNSRNKNVDTTPCNICLVETDDSNVIPDSPDMCTDDIQNDQNDVESDDERVALANLITNLKFDVDENKKIQKQLNKANTTLAHELKECKTILAETSKTLEESNTLKDIEIKEGLKSKAYEISVVKEKHDELIKQSLLTKSHYEGLVKQKTKFVPILGYGDLVQGNIMINRVYYVEGLNHNLFSVGQFCDADLEVAFRKSTCFVRDLQDIVIGLPKLKYVKDQLCSSCELSKAKISSYKSKAVPSSKERLNLLHMDLCGPMRVASINGKKYILVIVDDYSRYTWTLFLRSKDETPEVLKEFVTMIQRNLQALVITVRTDRGTKHKTYNEYSNYIRTIHSYICSCCGKQDNQAEEEHSPDDDVTSLFCAPPQEVAECFSHNIDANHAGCINSRKSTSIGIQFLCDKLVSWMSKKQNCTAMSSAEAEYVALSASCAQFITEYQLANMFTKALPKDRFKYLVRRIGMRCLTPAELEVLAKESA